MSKPIALLTPTAECDPIRLAPSPGECGPIAWSKSLREVRVFRRRIFEVSRERMRCRVRFCYGCVARLPAKSTSGKNPMHTQFMFTIIRFMAVAGNKAYNQVGSIKRQRLCPRIDQQTTPSSSLC